MIHHLLPTEQDISGAENAHRRYQAVSATPEDKLPEPLPKPCEVFVLWVSAGKSD